MGRREEIVKEIAFEEARLADLRSELEEHLGRLSKLREELEVLASDPFETKPLAVLSGSADVPRSNSEKVVLFRSLFRGREDVFPRRWENPKTGKSGYSPACLNEWERRLCEKKRPRSAGRRVTCGECPNKAFLPVTDEEITKHLRGEQVMGVYPLLADESCWFLAVDCDKKLWKDDIEAFVMTCKAHGVSVAVERSRSGKGAHAWFFFAAPVPAAVARKLGCFLITEAMSRRHQLSMESYDRLFPSQDTMPKGGFGSLIALPLQREAREYDNSVFIDESLLPFPDQWAFLASIQRIAPSFVHALVDEATRRGQVIGVRMSDLQDGEEGKPWSRSPTERPSRVTITDPLPPVVRGVLCQRLFIEKAGLPSPLLNQIKRVAAFQNPEFYKKQSMRLSTALTPRVITCAEDLADHIALPRGCRPDVVTLLQDYGVSLVIEDLRVEGTSLGCKFQGTLTPIQEEAARAMLAHNTGVFVAPPGIGKTVVGTYLVAARGRNTLVLVHRKPLLEQWVAQLALFLGIDKKEIGEIGGGKNRPNGHLDVAMLQSLVRKGQVNDLVAEYGQVITDECHHVPCVSFDQVLPHVKARYVVGLTATPQRRDGHHPILHMQLGPVRFTVNRPRSVFDRPFVHRLIVRETGFRCSEVSENAGIQEFYAALAADQKRNDLIFNDVLCALEEKRSPIVLTERRDHLEALAGRLCNFARNLIVLHGGMKPKERRQVLARLA